MQVVRHEAVRANCERALAFGAQNLTDDEIDWRRGCKQARQVDREVCQEITVKPNVGEAAERFRVCRSRGAEQASGCPGSPPEGGPHRLIEASDSLRTSLYPAAISSRVRL